MPKTSQTKEKKSENRIPKAQDNVPSSCTSANQTAKNVSARVYAARVSVGWLHICLHCQAIKKYIRNRSKKEAKKMKCYNRPTLEKLLQVSGLCSVEKKTCRMSEFWGCFV